MKRLNILLAILLPLSAMAQTPTFESLFNEYSTKEKCTTINISNAMLRSMEVNIDAEYMQVIAVENRALIPTFITQAKEVLSAFEVIMSVNSGDKAVMIYQHTVENGSVVDIYIMASSDGECVLMHINGKNLELGNMSSLMNMV
jgi:hypothetical protein